MPKRNFIWLLALVVTALLAVWLTRAQRGASLPDQNGEAAVADLYRNIRQKWYPGVGEPAYRQAVLEKMVALLNDPYSVYVDPVQGQALRQRVLGSHRGVGLLLQPVGNGLEILGTDPGSPAHRGGLVPGDLLLAVDGVSTAEMAGPEGLALLDGEVGTEHILRIARPGQLEPSDVSLTVERYPVETVVGLARDSDGTWIHRIGPEGQFVYVRVREFVQGTAGAFHQAVHLGGARGLILDLRGNPGGLLPVAVDLANMFLRDGLIVEIRSVDAEPQTHHARTNGTYPPVPVVVLIDEHSASGAELVAGALGHHARALLIGRRTRGKGLVQSLLALPEQAGYVYLTTSEFRVAGRSILPTDQQPGGVAPHVTVVIDRADRRRLDRLRQLAGLLPASDQDDPTASQTRRQRIDEILRLDNQLAEAIDWLSRPEQLQARLEALAAGNGGD